MDNRFVERLTAAIPHDFDDTFELLLTSGPGEMQKLKTIVGVTFSVDLKDDTPAVDKWRKKTGSSNLKEDVPNVIFSVGGKVILLTWDEAYNLGQALKGIAEVAYFG